MSASRQTMPAADAAWLHMERATNPMVVNSLVRLGEVPALERVAAVIEERMVARFPRFGQRVVDRLGRTPAFEDDPFFSIDDHLHRLALPAPGDRTALEAMVGDLITPPLDPGKPLWHAYLIEGYEGGAAILWRIHHCVADGMALAEVMLALTDGPAPAPRARHAHGEEDEPPHHNRLRRLAGGVRRDATTVAKLLASPADAPTGLRRPLAGSRRVAWTEPTSLSRVKDCCHHLRVTVNDMLLAALAATLATTLGEESPEDVHAMIPVNLRPPDRPVPAELGNDFALVLLELPLGELRPAERLRQVNSRMHALKDSHEAPISFGLLGAMGMTPPVVESRLIEFFTDKASMVVTNVPGPEERLSFAGVPIDGVHVWAPCSGSLGLTVSIFSYAGEVNVGFMADTGLVPDPEPLARTYESELSRLCP